MTQVGLHGPHLLVPRLSTIPCDQQPAVPAASSPRYRPPELYHTPRTAAQPPQQQTAFPLLAMHGSATPSLYYRAVGGTVKEETPSAGCPTPLRGL